MRLQLVQPRWISFSYRIIVNKLYFLCTTKIIITEQLQNNGFIISIYYNFFFGGEGDDCVLNIREDFVTEKNERRISSVYSTGACSRGMCVCARAFVRVYLYARYEI